MHNEHYESLAIDTITKWKANKTLGQLIDACEFQIDKYNSRPKEGEELKDCDKIVFYANLKKECLKLVKLVHTKEMTYNLALEESEKPKDNDDKDVARYNDNILSFGFAKQNKVEDLTHKYFAPTNINYKVLLGDLVQVIVSTQKFIKVSHSNGTSIIERDIFLKNFKEVEDIIK